MKTTLYKDEVSENAKAFVFHCLLSNQDKAQENQNDGLAKFQAVVHPENVHNFLNCQGEHSYSIHSVVMVPHDYQFTPAIDIYADVKGCFCTLVSMWDIDSQRWVSKIAQGDKYGTPVWKDRRYIELEKHGKSVFLQNSGGISGMTTKHLATTN